MNRITKLALNEIFVYGSNTAGINGKGAALDARRLFGAEPFIGEGPTGLQCYAIPTKDAKLKTLPLTSIRASVIRFIKYATEHPEKRFILTPVGTGLAGIPIETMALMFRDSPANVVQPEEFKLIP